MNTKFKNGDRIKFATSKGDIYGTVILKKIPMIEYEKIWLEDELYVDIDSDCKEMLESMHPEYIAAILSDNEWVNIYLRDCHYGILEYKAELVTDESPVQEEIPNEILDLVRFICQTWAEIDAFVYNHCDGDSLSQYPVIQGTGNQINLKKIGEQHYNADNLKKAVKWMLKRD